MPSPFPGMDPYLESHWRDVHHTLITYARDAIQEALPLELRARVEERVVLESPEGWDDPMFPDLRVIERRPPLQGGIATIVRRGATEPLLVDAEREALTEGFIEIIDARSGNRVVTIVEVLSPTNKLPGEDRKAYERKQADIVRSDTNLVEIDLLRCGKHLVAVPLQNIAPWRRAPYMVCVRRAAVPSKAEVYPMPLSEPLPTVKVPLRPTDADVQMNLQALIEECYRKGRYEGDVDYRLDPDPPLRGTDAEWALELLRGKGLRPAAAAKRKRKRKPPRAGDGA
jgi:hypothetical protein